MVSTLQMLKNPEIGLFCNLKDIFLRYRSSKIASKVPFTLRDLISWIDFVNKSHLSFDIHCCLVHGICLVLFDGLGTGSKLSLTFMAFKVEVVEPDTFHVWPS